MDIIQKLLHRFTFGNDQAPEEETIDNIEQGIEFQGAKLWVLILAIFVASLGLNTNSTAVIIGAMLISPLMGPILGMGLSAGIHDFVLLKKAFKNYFVATLFSVVTACVYFVLSPFDAVQSELLARTSPTIYDVLIALCGGLAGIIALSSKSQRTGNVIPGVAIATALMPPLCTVGFGLATANWMYALGALYLYLINTVFISLATYIGVEFIFKFNKRTQFDSQKNRKFKYILALVGIFVILPSLYMTTKLVRKSIFEDNAHRFCREVMNLENTHLIGSEANYDDHTLKLVLMGEEMDSACISMVQSRLVDYNLEGTTLSIIQGANTITEDSVKNMLSSTEARILASNILKEEHKIDTLQNELNKYRQFETLTSGIYKEVKVLYPQVSSLTLSKGTTVSSETDSTTVPSTVVIYEIDGRMAPADQAKLKDWLKVKLDNPDLIVVQK